MSARAVRRVAVRPVRKLAHNWDGALVLFTALISGIGSAWAVSELGMTAPGSDSGTVILGVALVVGVFTVATGTVVLWMHALGRRRAKRERLRREALRVHRATLAGG